MESISIDKLILIILILILAIVAPLLNIILVTFQNLMKKPYHKLTTNGQVLDVYFCKRDGYVPYRFVKRNDKWKRTGIMRMALIYPTLGLMILVLLLIGGLVSGFNQDQIIFMLVASLCVTVPVFALKGGTYFLK